MEFLRNVEPLLKLNTKGCCFLCLKNEEISQTKSGNQIGKSIKSLLRHLQIIAKSSNESSLFAEEYKHKDILVHLCENCGQMISRFSVLFQELEKIQLEMDYFLERFHKSIEQSAKAPELVQNYSKRMTSDLEALSQLAFVDNLRKQVAKQSLKLNGPRPQLILTRASVKQIKTENMEETCESNDMDFSGDCIDEEISPLSSPNSTADQEEDFKCTKSSASIFTENKKRSPSLHSPVQQRVKRGEYYSKHQTTGMYECRKCQKKSKYSRAIIQHYKIVHLKLRHKCDICNVSVFTYSRHLIGMYECNKCDKKSKCRKTISYHYKSVHLKLKFKCDICSDSTFSARYKLNLHKRTCREKLEKKLAKEKDPKFKYICKICGKRFETSRKLANHTWCVHKNSNRYRCDLCDKKYTSKGTLMNHQAAIHQARKLRCKGCNEIYQDLASYRKHERKCVTVIKVKLENVECE